MATRWSALFGLAILWPAVLAGQQPAAGTALVTAWGGGAAFSDFDARAARAAPAGGVSGLRYRHRYAARSAVALGVSAAYWPSATWGLRLHGAYAPSTLHARLESEAAAYLRSVGFDAGRDLGTLDVWLYDLTALVRIPFGAPSLQPYALAGAGAVHYRGGWRRDTAGAAEPPGFRSATRLAGVFGVGALVPLGPGDWALSFELVDHLTAGPLRRAEGPDLYRSEALVLRADEEGGDQDGVGTTSHVRFVIGFTRRVSRR